MPSSAASPLPRVPIADNISGGEMPMFRNLWEHIRAKMPNFRAMAADEIERFRREIFERAGDARQAESLIDQDLLREVMNTVGKPGRLGAEIRCVVSVSMLNEGWDVSTVTHVVGVRAFGTQLLCEQVIGRALRRQPQVLYELTYHLLLSRFRDVNGEPRLHLFGQLKRIARQWLDTYLQCKGGTYPAQLKYKTLADMACERITAGITRAQFGERPIMALLDPYTPVGSTRHVNFNTSKTERWETDARRCHLSWVILDSDWEAEFCRVAEGHPRVRAYVKNHNLGFEVPYRYGSEMRRYRPDFIVRVDDGHGEEDLLNLTVETKGYRGEDAKEKKTTMDVYWVPGVNNLGTHGRWAFAEFADVYQIESDFKAKVESAFDTMIAAVCG